MKKTVSRKEIQPNQMRKNKGPKRFIYLGYVYLFNGYGWYEERLAEHEDMTKIPHLVD